MDNRFKRAAKVERNPLSIMSLLTMAGIAACAIKDLTSNEKTEGKSCVTYPWWTMASFFFTIGGGVGGALW